MVRLRELVKELRDEWEGFGKTHGDTVLRGYYKVNNAVLSLVRFADEQDKQVAGAVGMTVDEIKEWLRPFLIPDLQAVAQAVRCLLTQTPHVDAPQVAGAVGALLEKAKKTRFAGPELLEWHSLIAAAEAEMAGEVIVRPTASLNIKVGPGQGDWLELGEGPFAIRKIAAAEARREERVT